MSSPKLDGLGVKLPESVWLDHKDTLHRLYIVENKRLSLVKRIMEDEHKFPPQRPCDYEVALRDLLHFRKNLKREEWRAIGIHISDRKRQSKESEVIWNNTRFQPKKVRKEVLRNSQPKSCLIRKVDPELPYGLVIRTPPCSPAMCAAVLLPSLDESANSPQAASEGSNHPISSSSVAEEDIWEVQQALVKAGEFDVSPYRKLRENLPFNRCMSRLLDVARSHSIHFCTLTAETWTPVFPRLFGANPSWELFGQQIFQLSNKQFLDHRHQDPIWFLKWLAISADFALLRAFFSIKTPTAGAVYETLLDRARFARIEGLVRILFELRNTLHPYSPTSSSEARLIFAAVEIGSESGDTLDIVKTCLHNSPPWSIMKHNERSVLKSYPVLTAACHGDIAMLRLLVDAGWKVESNPHGDDGVAGQIMNHIYDWDLNREHSLTDYIELLLRGGVLNGSASPQCIDVNRPKVITRTFAICSITWDEVVMICPPTMRQALHNIFLRLIADQRTCISRAGVFMVAQNGVTALRAYLEAHREVDAFLTRVTLEECLLFSAIVNDSKTASVLLEVGVDPYVGLLSKNRESYRKGTLPWNPSIVAAAAGHLEVLTPLLSHIDLPSFFGFAPIHELVQHDMLYDEIPLDVMGRDLRRLKNLRHSYLRAHTRSSALALEGSLDGLWDALIGRHFDTIEFIRNIAHSQGLGDKVDLEIIKAAVSHTGISWVPRHQQHLPCDVLLMKGLIDAHLKYKEEGMDLLHLSIRNHCSFTVVRFLSDKGFKVHSSPGGHDRNSMLHDALLGNSPDRSEIVEFLLEKGAHCKIYGEGLTILEASLWNCGVVVGQRSEYGRTFERLLDAGARVHPWPRKPLSNWRPLICLLLQLQADDGLILRVVDAGASLNIRGYGHSQWLENMTPLQTAIIHGRERLARELIRRGADVHAPASPQCGLTALQAACLHDLPIHFLEYLVVTLGVRIDEPPANIHGLTSLAGAVWGGSLNAVEFLLNHGAEVNAMCRPGAIIFNDENNLVRPLDVAVYFGALDMVELLLKSGGRSRKAGLGGAIDIAAREGHFAVLSILRRWNEKRGRRILEGEALWQRQNPEQALMLSESTYGPFDSSTDEEEDNNDTKITDYYTRSY